MAPHDGKQLSRQTPRSCGSHPSWTEDPPGPWWTPVAPLKILQVCPSMGTACGVANFATNFAHALAGQGFEVSTVRRLQPTDAHLVLIQHEFGLFDNQLLQQDLAGCPRRKVLFAHTAGVERFAPLVHGFLAMCPGMVQTTLPLCIFPHPGWYSGELGDRPTLQEEFGYRDFACVLGSNGFISPARQFREVIERLLPLAVRHNWLINLLCSRHAKHDLYEANRAEEDALTALSQSTSHLRLDLRLKDHAELNRQFQACDLLWCWTKTPSRPYASGTCADQYASGTRLVVAQKQQHSSLLGLPNVVFAAGELPQFVDTLVGEILAGRFSRHDGSILSWEACIRSPAAFLRALCECRQPASPVLS